MIVFNTGALGTIWVRNKMRTTFNILVFKLNYLFLVFIILLLLVEFCEMKRKRKRSSKLYRCSDGVDSPALCTVDSVEGHVCSHDHKLRCELSRRDLEHYCCARESDDSSGGSDSGSDEGCVDTGTNCENRMTASGTHWCILPQYYERMMVDCRKTCNRCKGRCEDLKHPDTGVSDCPDRKYEGFCDKEIYRDLMVWQCPKMCGWKCDSKTDRPPPKGYTEDN